MSGRGKGKTAGKKSITRSSKAGLQVCILFPFSLSYDLSDLLCLMKWPACFQWLQEHFLCSTSHSSVASLWEFACCMTCHVSQITNVEAENCARTSKTALACFSALYPVNQFVQTADVMLLVTLWSDCLQIRNCKNYCRSSITFMHCFSSKSLPKQKQMNTVTLTAS